jgi:hypothetical protein
MEGVASIARLRPRSEHCQATRRRPPSLFTSRSRTQGIAHHEKVLGFVVVWSQMGGDHHRGVAPTFRITTLFDPTSSKGAKYRQAVHYSV